MNEPVCQKCGRRGLSDHWVRWCVVHGAFGEPVDRQTGDLNSLAGRRRPNAATREGKPWEAWEREFVLANMASLTLEELGPHLQRGEGAVRAFLRLIGVRKPYALGRRGRATSEAGAVGDQPGDHQEIRRSGAA